jgi:hypothetical protein
MSAVSIADRRIKTIGLVLGLEYLGLSFAYDAAGLRERVDAPKAIGVVGVVAGAAIVVLALTAVAFGDRVRAAWAGAVAG